MALIQSMIIDQVQSQHHQQENPNHANRQHHARSIFNRHRRSGEKRLLEPAVQISHMAQLMDRASGRCKEAPL